MLRLKVTLDRVICADPEDMGPSGDEFYLKGSLCVLRPGKTPVVRPILTKPVAINRGEVKQIGQGGGTIFDDAIEEDSIVKIELTAMDEDASKQWGNVAGILATVSGEISDWLNVTNDPDAQVARKTLEKIEAELHAIQNDPDPIDPDDDLGFERLELTANQMSHMRNWPLNFSYKDTVIPVVRDWNYLVLGTITGQPV